MMTSWGWNYARLTRYWALLFDQQAPFPMAIGEGAFYVEN